jgi:hypothetical protein
MTHTTQRHTLLFIPKLSFYPLLSIITRKYHSRTTEIHRRSRWYPVGYISTNDILWDTSEKKNSCIRDLGESVLEVVSGGKLELRRGMVNICSGWSPDCGQWVVSLGPPHGDVGGRNWPTYWLRDGRSRSSLTVVCPRHASSVQGRLSMMNMINLSFTWFLMMWVFSRVCSGVSSTLSLGWGSSPQCRVLEGDCVSFLGGVVSGMRREGNVTHGVRVVFTSCNTFKQPKIYILFFITCISPKGSGSVIITQFQYKLPQRNVLGSI